MFFTSYSQLLVSRGWQHSQLYKLNPINPLLFQFNFLWLRSMSTPTKIQIWGTEEKSLVGKFYFRI